MDIDKLAREADQEFGNLDGDMPDAIVGIEAIRRFAALVVEECAKAVDDAKPRGGRMWTDEQAACYDCLSHVADFLRNSLIKPPRSTEPRLAPTLMQRPSARDVPMPRRRPAARRT